MVSERQPEDVTIHRSQGGGTRVTVTARIENGVLTMEGQDLGEAPLRHFGEYEYEYFVTVENKYVDQLTLALLKERFGATTKPTSDFMAWLKERGIPYEFTTF
jgi:hypothetical protein